MTRLLAETNDARCSLRGFVIRGKLRLQRQARGLVVLFVDAGALERQQYLAHGGVVGLRRLARALGVRRHAAVDLGLIGRHRHVRFAGHGNCGRGHFLRQRGRGEQCPGNDNAERTLHPSHRSGT